MRTRREKLRRSVRKRNRAIALEALGSRIALSAGGFGGALLDGGQRIDTDRGYRLNHEAEGAAGRLALAGEYASLQTTYAPIAPARFDQAGASRFDMQSHDRGIPQRQPDLRAYATPQVSANAWIVGADVSLPGLVLSPGTVLIVITSSPSYGTLGTPQAEPQASRSEPSPADRQWAANLPSTSDIANHFADSPELKAGGASQSVGGVRANVPSGSSASRGDNSPVAFASNVVQTTNVEPRVGRVGTSTGPGPTEDKVMKTVPQVPLAAGQWSIATAELESGLIELESPLAPRRKGRLLVDEDLAGEAAASSELENLERLVEGFWTAWSEAWAAFGDGSPSDAGQETTPNLARTQHAGQFDAGVIDGLVELVVDGNADWVADQPSGSRFSGESNAVVRMNAGVVIYQEFEIATAQDAVPQTTTAQRSKNQDAENDNAKSEERTTEEQPHAAALVGVGLLVGLPFAGRKRGEADREIHPRQLRLRRNA